MAKSRSNPAGFVPVLTRVEMWARMGIASKKGCLELNECLDRIALWIVVGDAHGRAAAFLPGLIQSSGNAERAADLGGASGGQRKTGEPAVNDAAGIRLMQRDGGVGDAGGSIVGDVQHDSDLHVFSRGCRSAQGVCAAKVT